MIFTYDYVVDAVDTVTAKIQIIMEAKCRCSGNQFYGAGNKLNPGSFVWQIYTDECRSSGKGNA